MPDSAELREALRVLESRAVAARSAVGLPCSRSDAVSAADEVSLGEPRLWALIQVWSSWAGEGPPDRDYWIGLIESSGPGGGGNYFSGDATTVIQVAGSVFGNIEIHPHDPRPGPPGWPASEVTDPFMLEVHRPIDFTPRPGTRELPVLPVYIEREHDKRLRSVVAQAVAGRSAIAVLVGGSSTGKTRACWEAIQVLPEGWRVWHPIDPGRPAAAVEAIGRIEPRTVVWLNDAHHYLLTPASGLGERVAAGLRELLRSPERGPVLVLGTIWPEHWARLIADPLDGQPDPHAQARALLTGTGIPVPSAFAGADLTAVREAAEADPRLGEACRAADGRITQFLAGVPVLVERYRNAPDAARAVIEAAMDARRLGYGLHLPRAVLGAMAPCYLDDQQWEALGQDWLSGALDYATVPCRGVRGPLTLIRPRPGQSGPQQPSYRLSDYLEQIGLTDRRRLSPPAGVWQVLAAHGDSDNLDRIAEEAKRRALYQVAFRLSVAAADAGHPGALSRAADLLEQASGTTDTLHWLEARVQADDISALEPAASRLARTGRTDKALVYYERAADAGRSTALMRRAELLLRSGNTNEALTWFLRAGEAGDPYAFIEASRLYEGAGRYQDALTCLDRAGRGGHPQALMLTIALLRRTSGLDEALRWLRGRTDANRQGGLIRAARLLRDAGRTDEALEWYRRAAGAGDSDATRRAADLLAELGRPEEALGWLRERDRADDPRVLTKKGELLEKNGALEEALGCYQRAAWAGDPRALSKATWLMEKTNRVDTALAWLEELAAGGVHDVFARGANMLERVGRTAEAIIWYQRADANELGWATSLLEKAGRASEAIAWLLKHVEAGTGYSLVEATKLLDDVGRADDARRLRRYGIEPGGRIASRWSAD